MLADLLMYVIGPLLGGGLLVAHGKRRKRKAEQVEASATSTLERYGSLLNQAAAAKGMWDRAKASSKARTFHRAKVKKHARQLAGKR